MFDFFKKKIDLDVIFNKLYSYADSEFSSLEARSNFKIQRKEVKGVCLSIISTIIYIRYPQKADNLEKKLLEKIRFNPDECEIIDGNIIDVTSIYFLSLMCPQHTNITSKPYLQLLSKDQALSEIASSVSMRNQILNSEDRWSKALNDQIKSIIGNLISMALAESSKFKF